MGLVHQAHHLLWGIDIAIKHPRPEVVADRVQVQAFLKECEIWSEIGLHPYIATCYYSEVMDNLPCVVAEFVDGGSLRDGIDKSFIFTDKEPTVLARLLTIAASSAWGLGHSHRRGLIHCDMKPGNLLLATHGIAKVTDFGLARTLGAAKASGMENWSTPFYASPEQSRGEILTASTDAWSWAASMLEMFVGGIFWGTGPACGAALEEYRNGGLKADGIPSMPTAFAELLGDCLVFDPAKRLSDFDKIAARVCACYEEIFGEHCPAQKPDLELVSADSLNNRAVSKYETGEIEKALSLLSDALREDPLHPEANFNLGLILSERKEVVPEQILGNLRMAAKYDLGNYRPVLFEACLLGIKRRFPVADARIADARRLAKHTENLEISRICQMLRDGKFALILSPAISGEHYSMDVERFLRLTEKAERALSEGRQHDAARYLLMSGDIPGFGRHPRRRRLLAKLESQMNP